MQRPRLSVPIVLALAAILLCLGSAAIAHSVAGCPPDIITESRAGVARARSVLPAGATSIQPKHDYPCYNTSVWIAKVMSEEALGTEPPKKVDTPGLPAENDMAPYLTLSGGERVYATWETEEFRFCCAASVAHLAITVAPKVPPQSPPQTEAEVIENTRTLTRQLLRYGNALVSHADLQESGTMHYRFAIQDMQAMLADVETELSAEYATAMQRFQTESVARPNIVMYEPVRRSIHETEWLKYVEVVAGGGRLTFIIWKVGLGSWIPMGDEEWFKERAPLPAPAAPDVDPEFEPGRTPIPLPTNFH